MPGGKFVALSEVCRRFRTVPYALEGDPRR
jgi:hypothetical protein